MMMQANGYMQDQFNMRYDGFQGDPMVSQGCGYDTMGTMQNTGTMGMGMPGMPDITTALQASVNFMEPLSEEQAVHGECIQQLENLVRQVGPGWEVKAFGSAANGFLSRGADLDVTCYKSDIQDQDSQLSLQELKFRFLPLLRQQPTFEVIQEVWSARVPIIKLRFMDIIDVDLSCHNPQALQNTYLLRAYSLLSSRLREVVLCVKCWAKAEQVCDAPKGHLSSYAFTLMVIYFLQTDPLFAMPCLPVDSFTSKGSGLKAGSYSWTCERPLSELLSRFFVFYAETFAWGSEVVSIRTGRRMSASDADYSTLPGRQANRLHVEDPFLPRNLNCVLSPENEEFLKQRLEHAAMTIQQQGVPEAFLQADPQDWLWQSNDVHGMQINQSMQVYHKMWLSASRMPNHQQFGMTMDRHWRRQMPMRSSQPKVATMMPLDGYSHQAGYSNSWNQQAGQGRGQNNQSQKGWIRNQAVYEHSFQRAPKFPPPTKPPKTSVLGMANVPMVSAKKQAPNEQKGQRSTPKVEVSKESSNQGRRASSAKAWLDGSELPTAPVEGKVPVPKFLM